MQTFSNKRVSPRRFASFFPAQLQRPVDIAASLCGRLTRLSHSPGAPEARPVIVGMPPLAVGADTAEAARCAPLILH